LLARYGGRASAEGVERLEAALDRYAGAWARKHRDVCEATRLRGEQSPAALDLRMACMDRRLAELDALVSTLAAVPPAATAPASDGGDTAAGEDAVRAAAEGDALADGDAGEGALARAVQAAWSLPGFEPCDDLIALQRDGAARPPAIAAVWPEFEAELARARQLLAAGAWSRAQRAGEQLRVRAEGWGFAPAVAQVELVLGRAASEGGDIDGAAAHLRRAVLEGDRGQDDRTRVEAWLALAELRAKRTVDGAAAREGIEAAAALVERLGAPIDLQAELAQVEGAAAYEAGDYPRALARFELARGLRARSLGDDHPLVAHGDANVGTALHAIGRHDEAIVALDRAVASLERTLGPGHPDVARARNDRAVALADAGRLADALTDHRAALAIRSEAFGPRHAHVAASHNNLGALQRRMGALEDARRSYAEALGIWRSLHGDEHPRVASAQFNVAIIDEAAGDHQAAVEGYAAALRGFEAGLGPDHPHAIAARFGRGVALVNLGRGGEAVNDLTRVLVVREAEGADDWTGEARYWLAQALWARDAPAERDRPADRTRALELARTTLADYPSAAEDYATFTAEVRAWLEARAPGPASARGAAR
jgi:tetratricopeptide (TPR) repeat protein